MLVQGITALLDLNNNGMLKRPIEQRRGDDGGKPTAAKRPSPDAYSGIGAEIVLHRTIGRSEPQTAKRPSAIQKRLSGSSNEADMKVRPRKNLVMSVIWIPETSRERQRRFVSRNMGLRVWASRFPPKTPSP